MPLHFPSWLQWYKKPAYVDLKAFADKKAQANSANSTPRSSVDSGSRPSRDVPSKLRLEKILKNETCERFLDTWLEIAATNISNR